MISCKVKTNRNNRKNIYNYLKAPAVSMSNTFAVGSLLTDVLKTEQTYESIRRDIPLT